MQSVSYLEIIEEQEARRVFCGVREEEDFYGTSEDLYVQFLERLSREFLKEKYSLCLQVRDRGVANPLSRAVDGDKFRMRSFQFLQFREIQRAGGIGCQGDDVIEFFHSIMHILDVRGYDSWI